MTRQHLQKACVLDPLSLSLTGRHLIEASAGTGKTYNITRIWIRLLLERRLQVDQILVMTFTRAATEELRGRIDRTLREALACWRNPTDAFWQAMAARVEAPVAEALLQEALVRLDEATIFTIHGFCARMLRQHALESGLPLELEMVEDSGELLLEAVRDWLRICQHDAAISARLTEAGCHQPEEFIQRFRPALTSDAPLSAPDPEAIRAALDDERGAVRQRLLDNEAELHRLLVDGKKDADKRREEWAQLLAWLDGTCREKLDGPGRDFLNARRCGKGCEHLKPLLQEVRARCDSLPEYHERMEAAALYRLLADGIAEIRGRFRALKARQGVLDFDDQVRELAARVAAEPALAAALRRLFPVALVDEFQDTDPAQWSILEQAYPGGGAEETALFMIGDPKQAIYAFRGGDIFTYLSARDRADYCWYMEENWRSVPEVIEGYNRLFSDRGAGSVFGPGIDYNPVRFPAAKTAAGSPLAGAPDEDRKAINYVWFEPAEDQGSADKGLNKDFRSVVANWLAAEVVALLEAKDGEGEPLLAARDIAVLVRVGDEAEIVRKALQAAGLASVYLSSRDNVLESPEAEELERALTGILECESRSALLAAESTALLGGDAARLARLNSDPDALAAARDELMALRQCWQRDGVIAMLMRIIHERLQPPPDRHERCLTNHLHLAELLQEAAGSRREPLHQLEWLREQRRLRLAASEREQRLESDDNLIRIVTMHGSKGLEYPVVFVPFASVHRDPVKLGNHERDVLSWHDDARALRMHLGEDEEIRARAAEEAYAETIRLLYVAVTRAEQRCYLCVAPFRESRHSPLGRTLGIGANDEWPDRLRELAEEAPDAVALLEVSGDEWRWPPASGAKTDAAGPELVVAEFRGEIDRSWRLGSFSALTRNLGHVRRDRRDPEEDEGGPEAASDLPLRFRLPAGARAGNLLHDILEHLDFAHPDWTRALEEPLARSGLVSDAERDELIAWLTEVLQTNLQSAGGGTPFRLADLGRNQTLREAEFYFPLGGATAGALVRLLAEHRGVAADQVSLPAPSVLRGMMHGFIDLVAEHEGRYFVIDYKSTHLGNRLEDYAPEALRANNEAHCYDLQYLIYSLALHRQLAATLPDYDPARHFGGVFYLYLRGMSPAGGSGVFTHAIRPQELEMLDRLMKGEHAA